MFDSVHAAAPLPRALADDLAVIRAALGRVSAAVELGFDRSGRARDEVLAQLDRIGGLTAAARGRWLRAALEEESMQGPGDPSPEAALSRRSRSGVGAAKRELRQAEALGAMHELEGAVEDGVVPVGHLDPVARALASATPDVRTLLTSPGMQRRLIELARRLDAPTFARRVAAIVAEASPGKLQRDHDAQRRSRYLRLSDGPDGTRISGLLDRISGHTLRLALEATDNRPGADREPEQACADALLDLATAVLDNPGTAPGAAVRPHVSLILREDTLAGLQRHERAAQDRRTAAARTNADRETAASAGEDRETAVGTSAGGDCGTHDSAGRGQRVDVGDGGLAASLDLGGIFPAATLEDGTVVPVSETTRILCDCEITRIAMTGENLPLNLGRTMRRYTGAHRRAVVARDRGCAWPGCERHVRWTQIHHIRWWDRDGGETSIENAAALCSFHHHVVHARDLTLERLGAPRGSSLGSGGRGELREQVAGAQAAWSEGCEYIVRDARWRVVAEPRRPAPRDGASGDAALESRGQAGTSQGEGRGDAASRGSEHGLFERLSA